MTVQDIVLKKLSLPENTQDIEMAIEEIGQKIRNIINIPLPCSLPEELNFTYANMVVQLFRHENPETEPELNVTSVTMGKVSYDFASVKQRIDAVVLDNYSDLLKYRRLRK